jgi:hypothetical protein
MINRGLRKGDALSAQLFNLILVKAIRNTEMNQGGSIYNRTLQYLPYADDVNLVSRSALMLSEAFKQLEPESKNAGLTINESETKYMINSRNRVRFQNVRSSNVGSYKFERVDKFKYLGYLVTENSENSTEIKIRIAAGNRCYFSLIKLLKSRAVARNTQVRMNKTIITSVVTYGSETWYLTANDERSLRTWEREVLRKIYGQVYDNGFWRIRTNKELMVLYQELDSHKDQESKNEMVGSHRKDVRRQGH